MLALVLGTYVSAAAQPQSRRTVLVVHWSAEEFPINPPRDAAIREVLLAPSEVPIDYFAEYLESDRFEEPGASQALRDYIQQKYRGRQIDLVIAVTDVALQFALQYRNDLISSNMDARLISSRSARFSFWICSSARLRSLISVPVAYHRTTRPSPSMSGLY